MKSKATMKGKVFVGFSIRMLLLPFVFLITQVNAFDKSSTITPFTGTNHVRVVIDQSHLNNPKNTIKVVINSLSDSTVLWEGSVVLTPIVNEGKKQLTFTIRDLSPKLWSPSSPNLYQLNLHQYQNGKLITTLTERLGFRSIESKNGNLFLNNEPIFLRGFAINPPNRGIPTEIERSREFALSYVKFLKSLNVNIIRIPDDETWYDVCDELGMLVFGGNYSGSVARGAKVENFEKLADENDSALPKDYDKGVAWYKHNKLGPIAHHPSLIVYAMTNETPFAGKRALEWEKFLSYAYDKLKQWDNTRVYIANAGYGYGKVGDICDLHRYWGWYYSSPFTFLHTRDNKKIIPFEKRTQPITFTECVGNYTGPDGRYNFTPDHKNPGSQLTWTGHASESLQADLADEHQRFTVKQSVELFRRLRVQNQELSGIFPFTILFYNWDTIKEFSDMNPKPVSEQLKTSFQPILVSWECWTPQVYSGSTIRAIAHIVNDDNEYKDLKDAHLIYELYDKTHKVLISDTVKLPDVLYYSTIQKKIDIQLPETISTGEYTLVGKVLTSIGIISKNTYDLFIADKNLVRSASLPQSKILLYDPIGETVESLKALGVSFQEISSFENIPSNASIIIGENAADEGVANSSELISRFIISGGRLLSLRQDSTHFPILNTILSLPFKSVLPDLDDPAYPAPVRPSRNAYYINPERPDHPIMTGIKRRNLRVWSDYTNWTESDMGFPAIYPVTDGFIPQNKESLSKTAVLFNYGAGLEGIAIAEQFNGKGSIIINGFDLVRRTGIDPIADRLLLNLIAYNANDVEHELFPLINSPIIWGDYESEKGVLTGINSGLIVNSTPRVPESYKDQNITITEEGFQFASGLRVAFASRPGLQYVANGRRPFGPYYLRGFGAMPETINKETVVGEGKFWCRVPAQTTMAVTKVWNPVNKPLSLKITINGRETIMELKPTSTTEVACPVNSEQIEMSFKGDRRLVLLETAFVPQIK